MDAIQESSENPTISVIVPVHNGSAVLPRCLEAIRGSTHRSFECIVVDDGSTDDSAAIATSFGVRLLRLPDGPSGPGRARNRAAAIARGEILLFVDADVVVHADTVAKVAATFAERPDVDAAFGSYDDCPGNGDFTSQYKNLFHHFVHQKGNEEAGTFWAGCGAIRRSTFLEIGGFDASRYSRPCIEDIDLGYRLRGAGRKILLNRTIQATHLKRWTLTGMIRSDVLDRGIPWARLILQHRDLPDDLNTRVSQRASALLLALLLLHLGLSAFFHNILILPLLVVLFLLVVGHWTSSGFRSANGGVEVAAGVLVGLIGLLALYLHMPWMLVPLVLLLAGLILGRRQKAGRAVAEQVPFAMTVLGLAAAFVLLLLSFPPWLVIPLVGGLAAVVVLNRDFYLFFARKRGAVFALAVVPFHMLYYLYSMVALVLGTGQYYWVDRARRSA